MTAYLEPTGLHRVPGAFTPVVRVGDLVFLAGQVARDEHGNLCGEDHPTRMRRLDVALAAVGCGRADVVVLVGHRYGGMAVAGVADAHPKRPRSTLSFPRPANPRST
ncbi:RidA family protein [Amycolatopsis rubida]|uniref:RidA family protein n=1 Tax=Amycolatopsis rubida TaxID=112413 RepID=UPI000B02E197|nr:RidA family protein [Amycolatopsis rubida]